MDKIALIHRIVELLSTYPRMKVAILFGSIASATDTSASDLDLAIYGEHLLSAEMKLNLIRQLASIAKRPVDLIDMRTAGEPLLGEILMKGERILGNDTDFAVLINRHLLDKTDFLPYRERLLKERREQWIKD